MLLFNSPLGWKKKPVHSIEDNQSNNGHVLNLNVLYSSHPYLCSSCAKDTKQQQGWSLILRNTDP